MNDEAERLLRETPIRQLLKASRWVGEVVLRRRKEDRKYPDLALEGQQENPARQMKKRARYRATCFPDVRHGSGAVHPPKEIDRINGFGKEVPKEEE